MVSPIPPSDKIGIKSVQRETEEIIPMKAMKMAWVPYIPLEDRYLLFMLHIFDLGTSNMIIQNYVWKVVLLNLGFLFFHRHSQVDRLKTQIFTLACTQRRYNYIYFFRFSILYGFCWMGFSFHAIIIEFYPMFLSHVNYVSVLYNHLIFMFLQVMNAK